MTLLASRISAPQWVTRTFRDQTWRHRISLVAGISPPPFAHSEWWIDGQAVIDASIAPLIARLNRCGYVTEFCCSGAPEDHEGDNESAAYIQFAAPFPVHLIPPGVHASADCTHLTFAGRICPGENRSQWMWLAQAMGVSLA